MLGLIRVWESGTKSINSKLTQWIVMIQVRGLTRIRQFEAGGLAYYPSDMRNAARMIPIQRKILTTYFLDNVSSIKLNTVKDKSTHCSPSDMAKCLLYCVMCCC